MSETIKDLFAYAYDRELEINCGISEPRIDDINGYSQEFVQNATPVFITGSTPHVSSPYKSGSLEIGQKIRSDRIAGLFGGFAIARVQQRVSGETLNRASIGALITSFTQAKHFWIPVQNALPELIDPGSFEGPVMPLIDELVQDYIDPTTLEKHCRKLPLYSARELGRISAMMNYLHLPTQSIEAVDIKNIFIGEVNPRLDEDANYEVTFEPWYSPLGVRSFILPHDEWYLARRGGLIQLFIKREDFRDVGRTAFLDISHATGIELVK